MMRFSGSHGALSEKSPSAEKPRAPAAALRASNLQVCPHTTLSPYKKTGVHLREHRSDLHVMWNFQLSAGPACRAPRLSLEPAIGLLVGRADVAHGTADTLGIASGAGFSPKVNPLFVDVFPELVGEKRE